MARLVKSVWEFMGTPYFLIPSWAFVLAMSIYNENKIWMIWAAFALGHHVSPKEIKPNDQVSKL